jgi:hypothetical protein
MCISSVPARTALAVLNDLKPSIGLVEDRSQARALNENRYFCSEWTYARHYGSVAGL